MAVSRAAVDRAGLLDEKLFAYVEDVEWSLRIRRAGLAVVFVPDARVRHRGQGASGGPASVTNLYYDTRNTIVVAERYRPLPPVLRSLRRAVVVGAHLVQAARHPARVAAARAVLAGWDDAGGDAWVREARGTRPRAPRSTVPRELPRALEPARAPRLRVRRGPSSTAAAIASAGLRVE